MTFEEFKTKFFEDAELTISELNQSFKNYGKQVTTGFNSDSSIYDFSWNELSSFMNEQNYGYSKGEKSFIMGKEPVRRNQTTEMNYDNSQDEFNENISDLDEIHKMIQKNIKTKADDKQVSFTLRFDEDLSRRIDSYIAGGRMYSKNQFLVDLIKFGLNQYDKKYSEPSDEN